jgi:DNA-binding response OmpR family regulator
MIIASYQRKITIMPLSDNTESIHIFLVEDDAALASLVTDYLDLQGFKVSVEERGDTATARILAEQPDLVILDIMLPGKNGLDICRELRAVSQLPIIMLTARSDDIDQIVGLEVGADDYIAKPAQPRLLLARINALLRRAQTSNANVTNNENGELTFGQLSIQAQKQEVYWQNKLVELTTNEFDLLTLLANNAGSILSRDDLLNQLRGFGYDGIDRTVDMLISRLRKKLGDDSAKPKRIKTVWKKGYLFVAEAWEN